MKSFATRLLLGASSLISCALPGALAQATLGTYTDPETGIVFSTSEVSDTTSEGGFTWGFALPPDAETVDATEYIGIIIGSTPEGAGWAGISHGGPMTSSLLLVVWPNEDKVLTSFRYASGYVAPDIYTGDATISTISSSINETHYQIIYRCQNCWSWKQGGVAGGQETSGGSMVMGFAQALDAPEDPADPDSAVVQHNNGFGNFGAPVASAVAEEYSSWVELAPTPTPSDPTPTPTPTPTPPAGEPVPTDSFDYIVVGGGAGGITVADRLSEDGSSVLLVERGPPSSYRWGGDKGPEWLSGSNLTRFDVPGLCNQIWQDSAGIACSDIDQMAGCVLGGGTAVNAALWWKTPAADWDYNFPEGWQSEDMAPAVEKVFSRIPGTDHPSMDGELYYQEGYEVIGGALRDAGWKNVTANEVPDEKHQTFSHTPYMFSNGERGGPMATYLVSASERPNFTLWMNTTVSRVIREGGHITGVEVEAFGDGGYYGVSNVTESTGRVVLSAGTFGTSKILMRSGIGPEEMLRVVQESTDGPTMIGEEDWIDLPVGENLVDHVNTDVVIRHPSVEFYDFYEAYTDPIESDAEAYLDERSGILAQSAPNIGPMFWEVIQGDDGIERSLQWTARVEPSLEATSNKSMTLSQYLGRGSVSRGKLSITTGLTMSVTKAPYLHDQGDIDAVVAGISHLQDVLSNVPNLTFTSPAPGQDAAEYVDEYVVSAAKRRSNHWMGTAKMGTDAGNEGGTAVVDLDTKVYGTDNLFVVDASIFPGMGTTNPSAPIMAVAEKAAERILAL
ncbi:hypothetical protein FQN54_002242 [Arachnomyces sp. PD_36]|nr:hypothetical protein FQN54_002242 [Arachnomyces sp. PD_36]